MLTNNKPKCFVLRRSVVSPGIISPNLATDAFHPHQMLSNHREKLHLVRHRGYMHATGLAGHQQLLPSQHHFLLLGHDGLGLLPSVDGPQLGSVLLQMPHLYHDRELELDSSLPHLVKFRPLQIHIKYIWICICTLGIYGTQYC